MRDAALIAVLIPVLALCLLMVMAPAIIIVLSCTRTRWRVHARAAAARLAAYGMIGGCSGATMGTLRCATGDWAGGLGDYALGGLWLAVWWIGGGGDKFRKKAARVLGKVKETVAGRLTVAPVPSAS